MAIFFQILFLIFFQQIFSFQNQIFSPICPNDINLRFDCLPDRISSQYIRDHAEEECKINRCCWSPINSTDDLIPSCFYPLNNSTYSIDNIIETDNKRGFKVKLSRDNLPVWPPNQSKKLDLNVQYINDNIVRVTFKHGDKSRSLSEFEPQVILEDKLPINQQLRKNYQVSVISNPKTPFGISVHRKSGDKNGLKLFDTSISNFM
jgi:hypothetical protein